MKYKVFKVVFGVLIIILFVIATFFLVKGLTLDEDKPSVPSVSSVDVQEKIRKLKENLTPLYESDKIEEFYSLIVKDEEYKSYLIDKKTGEELDIKDIIKKDKWEEFIKKEEELLDLKYPSFIADTIKSDKGRKVYTVYNNKMIVYYYDYEYAYDVEEEISLVINYQEVHDYLDFTHELDSEYQNEDGYNYSKDKKVVALTLDDGPSSAYNSQILDILAKNKAHATFFMVGTMMNSCQKCVLNTYESGNEVGSHTYNHINISKNSTDVVLNSIKKTDDLFYNITGSHIKYVRPPYGAYDRENLSTVSYPLILWDIDPEDWRYHDSERIVNHIIEHVDDGSIILMHEIYKTSVEALEELLPRLYSMGYQVVSISELAYLQDRVIESGHAYISLH